MVDKNNTDDISSDKEDLSAFLKAELARILPEVIEISRHAGEIILAIYKTDFHVENKKDNTPVTTADLEANEHIVRQLSRLTPDFPILSEESDEIPYTERESWETYWLVDPLDGTRAFIEKTGEFSVNIALIHGQKPVLGVIYSPVKKFTYYAYQGYGAFFLNKDNQSKAVDVCTQYPKDNSRKIVIAGTHSAQSPALKAFLSNLKKEFNGYELKYMGSSLKSCMVAAAEADLYVRLGPTSEWDTAAAQCIVEQAGGRITDTQLQSLRYNTKESLLNPDFFVFGDRSICWSRFLDD